MTERGSVQGLLRLGREKDYLLYDEIRAALPDNIPAEDLVDVLCLFDDAGIEVVLSQRRPAPATGQSAPKPQARLTRGPFEHHNVDDPLSPLQSATNSRLQEQTMAVLRGLSSREKQIIRMRFGFGDGSEHTLEEVGREFSFTRERVRQIEVRALQKLRHPTRHRKLRAYLEERSENRRP